MMDRMGEGNIRAPETRSSGLRIVPWDGSARSTSPAVRHIQILPFCGIRVDLNSYSVVIILCPREIGWHRTTGSAGVPNPVAYFSPIDWLIEVFDHLS
jgi:hypothetical protein